MKNLIPHFIQEAYQKNHSHGQFQAYTMFVDLSGFTPLTDTLMQRGNEGAEQLSLSLNNIFAPMVKEVYQLDGFIPYFAGDSFTAIFEVGAADIKAQDLIRLAQSLRDMFRG